MTERKFTPPTEYSSEYVTRDGIKARILAKIENDNYPYAVAICDIVTWVQFKAASRQAADRIEELEAKLTKAVTRLQHIAANKTTGELTVIEWDTYDMFTLLDTCISEARTTLAELKGEK